MSNQRNHDRTKEFIDDAINSHSNGNAEFIPEVTNDSTANQLQMANYYPAHHNTTQSLPFLSESALSPAKVSPHFTDESGAVEDGNAINNKALTKLNKLKKPKLKKAPAGPKSRPAFVIKLWNMVNDAMNDDYIKWAPDGKSFIVINREEFMKYILPKYFKHNNFASFVRQLNMYGWHKVQDVTHDSIHSSGSQQAAETLQFVNPNFVKDREDLLDNIVRNRSSKEDEDVDFGLLLNELETIKMNQIAIVEDLRRIRSDNQLLWEENFSARERHDKQTQALDKIMRFLHQVYGNGNRIEGANNFNFGDLVQATQAPYYPNSQQQGAQLQQDFLPQQNQSSDDMFNKPRLMLTDTAHKRAYPDNAPSVGSSVIQEIEQTPKNVEADTPASSTSNNHHPLIQELIDTDVANMNSLAPSPRALFPELANSSSQSRHPPQQQQQQQHQHQALENNPNFIDKLEESIERQGQSIQQVNDWIARLAAESGSKYDASPEYDEYTPSEDSNSNNFNVEEFLAPTPQDFAGNGVEPVADDQLFIPNVSPSAGAEADTTKKRSPTDHVGTIDEIVEEPETKRRRSGRK